MTVKYLLQNLFDLKSGKRKSVTLYNKDATATATLCSEKEDVFGHMTQEEIFYKKEK